VGSCDLGSLSLSLQACFPSNHLLSSLCHIGTPITQVYCNHENRQAYNLIWTEWFKAIRKVTGKGLQMKAIHKQGKHAVFMVNSSAPQIQELGNYLITQNVVTMSGIETCELQVIIQHVCCICNVHCKRYTTVNFCHFLTNRS